MTIGLEDSLPEDGSSRILALMTLQTVTISMGVNMIFAQNDN